jgi:predicted ATPase/DNA-binding CsgD family transcriptional regulator/tetratricopeptide (TPR) repeat protein
VTGFSGTLPAHVTRFVGRADEQRSLRDLVRRHRLVTLTGLGGSGKTRLATAVASALTDEFENGVWFVDLAALAQPAEVDGAVAHVLRARTGNPGRSDRQAIVDGLRDRHALIVLDNCEHVLEASGELVSEVLGSCAAVHVLATSRELLDLHGESSWPVQPLSVPDNDGTDSVWASESGELFADRARLAMPRFEVTETNAAAISRICHRVDGIPLAIELAAARLRTMPLDRIAADLDGRLTALAGGGHDVVARQQSLEASIAWSYDLLSPMEADVFRQLAVFHGGFALEAAEAVVALPADPRHRTAELLGRLVDRSLVNHVVDRGGEDRYVLLETVRVFAAERLDREPSGDAVRDRHLRWMTEWCTTMGDQLEGPNVAVALRRVPVELPNIRAALRFAEERQLGAPIASVLGALVWFWVWEGYHDECIGWLDRLEPLLETMTPSERLPASWCGVQISMSSYHHHRRTPELLARLVAESVEVGDARMLARANGVHALGTMYAVDVETFRPIAEDAIERCRATGDAFWMARLEAAIGYSYQLLGRNDLSIESIDRMGRLVRLTGNPVLTVQHLSHRSWNALAFGDFDAVRADLVEMRRLYEPLEGCNVSLDTGVGVQALMDVQCGLYDDARQALELLLQQLVRDGDYLGAAAPGFLLSTIYVAQGETEQALFLLDLGRPHLEESNPHHLRSLVVRGLALLALDDRDAARDLLTRALERAGQVGHLGIEVECRSMLGMLDRRDGDLRSASRSMHAALENALLLGYPVMLAGVLEELAGVELDSGRPENAARLLGAAEGLRAPRGAFGRSIRQAVYDADVAGVRVRLGEAVDEVWSVGRSLPIKEVVALVLPDTREGRRPTFGWDSLTPTERKVAELVAQGLSNPAIAERLLMGRETVKTHLSHIYTKLGISNRAELAVEVTRRTRTAER